ncbi:hypothetical protein H0H87_003970 [Tephrocybe sp. NHM501043]|nr:hypothetical protein H0H87_003970 [Tephrocybe sp. NHM501043]
MKSVLSLLLPITLATSAFSHGFVANITIDGKIFKGNTPQHNPANSIIRLVNTTSSVKGVQNPDLNCGSGASTASDIGEAMPGSKLTFQWSVDENGTHWAHNTGPLMTYVASCNTTCDKFDSTQAKWFKIDQQGHKPDGDGNRWVQENMKASLVITPPTVNGDFVNVTIPANLAPGDYLIRHEIIALHNANATNPEGAEFYPSCAQVKVGGTQTGKPTDAELVSFPGGYSLKDPGITCKDINVFSNQTYVFPGPPVATFISSSTVNGTTGGYSSGPTNFAPLTVTVTITAVPSTSHKTCGTKLRRKGGASSSVLTTSAPATPHTSFSGKITYSTSATSLSTPLSLSATSSSGKVSPTPYVQARWLGVPLLLHARVFDGF